MANSTTSPQIPQHVSALLSHLTSRPGVQSTLILSRKDGSIIQTTGLLAPPKRTRSETSSPDMTSAVTEDTTTTATTTATSSPPSAEAQQPSTTSPTSTQQQKPYQPSQAESIAAHIFAFVSSASNLSFSLSHPLNDTASPSNGIHESGLGNGSVTGTGRDDGEGEGSETQDDGEVKLLRLRTKKHEIVVVPDRKYLLCVVQDATANAAGGAALATGVGGRLSR
ncbi:hypothetical protein BJX76DRAFT_147207 [Aspergillus varians]